MASAEHNREPKRASTYAPRPGLRRLGKYELIARIGKGGMAQVYLARQRGLMDFEKIVVVKTIHPHLAEQQGFIDMLLDEARIAARIEHPCVVDIYDLGIEDDTYFIAMEHLAGQSLVRLLRAGVEKKPLDVRSRIRIIADIADGLHAAHELKDHTGRSLEVIHRDVTPGNIVVQYSGRVKIVDFGIAKARGRIAEDTGVRRWKGKLNYMAPEHVTGKPIDRRVDIFSLGVVMWESLALRRLFRYKSAVDMAEAIVEQEIQPPSRIRSDVPPKLDSICLRALERDPDKRYATCAELLDDLEKFLSAAAFRPQHNAIAKYMQEMFADEIAERETLLREVAAATTEIKVAFARGTDHLDDALDGGPGDGTSATPSGQGAITGSAESESNPQIEVLVSPGDDRDASGHAGVDEWSEASGRLGTDSAPGRRKDAPEGQRAERSAGASRRQDAPEGQRAERSAGASRRRDSSVAEALFGAEGKGGRVASVVDPSRAVRLDTEAQRFVDRNKQRRAIIITGAVALAVLVIVIATTRGDGKSSPRAPGDDRLATSSSPGTDSVTKTPDTSATSPGPDTTKTSAGTTASDPAGARAGVQTDAGEDRNATSEAAGITGTPGGDTETVATNPVKAGEPEIATDDRSTATTDEVPVDNPRSGGSRGQTPRASASTLYNQGFDYFVKGRLGPARDKFRASLRVNPRYAQAHRGLGLVYERMGNKKQAAKAYREYLRLAPRAGDAETIRRKLAALGG